MMTFEEFKEVGNKCGLFYSTATDEDIQSIYKYWNFKCWYSKLASKEIHFTRTNGLLNPRDMSANDMLELYKMNEVILKHYLTQQKLIKLKEDFK